MTELEKAVDDLTKDFGLEVSGGDFTKEQYLKYSQAILALIQDEVRRANNKPVEIAGSLHKGGGVIGSSNGAVILDYVLDPENTGTLSFKITYLPTQLSEGKE